MKIQIVKIGKPAHKAYEELVSVYSKRLRSIWKIEEQIVKVHADPTKYSKDLIARLGLVPESSRADSQQQLFVALDERGQEFSSIEFAGFIQESFEQRAVKSLIFLIGGPYGLSEELRSRAHRVIRLSRSVFPSDLAWLILWEQLYRASTIIRGTSYHHE